MAIVLKLGDVIEFNYIKPERTIVLTTKTIIYEIVVNSEENARALIVAIQNALKPDAPKQKELHIPKFYSEKIGDGV
jgi:hypothetical protein